MTTGQATITLRTIARRLPKLLKIKKKTAISELLSLLRSGQLSAGFQFPGRVVRWISIPPSYWAKIDANKLRTLGYERGDPKRPGTFKVGIPPFADELVRRVADELRNNTVKSKEINSAEAALAELRQALSLASERYEVVILEQVWTNYLQQNKMSEPAYKEPKAGRDEKVGWRDLTIIIGAYVLKHREITDEKIKVEESAKKIHEIAKAQNVTDLPAWPTIKDALSKILSTAATLSIK